MQSDLHAFYKFMHLLGMEPMTFALLETSVVMQRNALHCMKQINLEMYFACNTHKTVNEELTWDRTAVQMHTERERSSKTLKLQRLSVFTNTELQLAAVLCANSNRSTFLCVFDWSNDSKPVGTLSRITMPDRWIHQVRLWFVLTQISGV